METFEDCVRYLRNTRPQAFGQEGSLVGNSPRPETFRLR
jgi:hypothetical protein